MSTRFHKKFSIAVVISSVLILLSTVYSTAGTLNQGPPSGMNLITALLVGTLYYLAASPWLANLGFTVLYRPLIAGTLVGLVMGRVGEGIAIGANINVLYLGWIGAGGSLPSDPALAGYLGTALALSSGLDAQAALAVAAPLGLLGGIIYSIRMSTCSVLTHRADKAAERGDIQGVAWSNLYAQPFLYILYTVPIAAAAYLGAPAVETALTWVIQNASWVLEGLYIASGMLAALGIALNLQFLFQGNTWPYFFIGFTIAAATAGEINLVILAVIGACLAFLHMSFTQSTTQEIPSKLTHETTKKPELLTKKDIFQAWLRWLFFSHAAYNWERMQGLGFAHSMTPIIRKLYTTREEISAALKRHLVFFNTQPDLGGLIHGVVIAMEEERAAGANISDKAINAIKTGLMGPLSGIGDTLQQGLVIPIGLAIAMNVATGGNIGTATKGTLLGPLLFLMIGISYIWGFGWLVWWQGYRQGRTAVTQILKSGMLNRAITGAGVLGNFIIGALAVSFVKLSTPIALTLGGSPIQIQGILDSFMPNLLPLLLIVLLWWLLARKHISPNLIMVWLIILSLLGAYPIWPGTQSTGELIKVGLLGN